MAENANGGDVTTFVETGKLDSGDEDTLKGEVYRYQSIYCFMIKVNQFKAIHDLYWLQCLPILRVFVCWLQCLPAMLGG